MSNGNDSQTSDRIKEIEGVKYVPESDLIAVKKGLEGKIEEEKTARNQEAEQAKGRLSEINTKLVASEAKVKDLEEKVNQGAGSAEELVKVKQDLETAQQAVESLSGKALESRRNFIMAKYGVAEETVKEKTMEQLDSYEEALKAVTSQGAGNYAITGVGTGAQGLAGLEPKDFMETARRGYEEKGKSK